MKKTLMVMAAAAAPIFATAGDVNVVGQTDVKAGDKLIELVTYKIGGHTFQLPKVERAGDDGRRSVCHPYIKSTEPTSSGTRVTVGEECT